MNLVPDKILTQHIAIVGRTGSGKTYAAKGFIERLLDAKRRVIVLDPTGAHWGLRYFANNKSGYHIPIIGGEHGDAPLSVENAERLAKWLIEKNASAVIDLSEMLIGERHRFVEHFSETLYRLNKTPLHLVVDEADEFMMQNPFPETKRMFHQMDRIVRRGRIKGFRVMMISQRPAVIHKNVLSQANTLIAMKLMSPQDRKAIEAWVEGQADTKQGKEVLDTLAKLQTGEGWIWSPEHNVLERMKFPKIKTFDSSRTPEDGEEIPQTNHAESTDFEELRTILNQEEELENNSEKIINEYSYSNLKEVEERAYRQGFQSGMDSATNCIKTIWQDKRQKVFAAINEILAEEINWNVAEYGHPVALDRYSNVQNETAIKSFSNTSNVNSSLPKAERLILTALAQYPQGRTKRQIAILTGYAIGGAFNNAMGSLRSQQFIEGSRDKLQITVIGKKSLGSFQPLPRGRALLEYWLGKLGKAEKSVLSLLASTYPKFMMKEDVAKQTGYAIGGAFNNALGKLRTLELIEGRGELKASDNLFL